MSTLTSMTIPSGESISKAGRTITVKRLKTPKGYDDTAAVDTVEICYNGKGKHTLWYPDVERLEDKARIVLQRYLEDQDSLGAPISQMSEKQLAQLAAARERSPIARKDAATGKDASE